ncbi:MAG: RNA 2',3'-cyclic phosphodiesterase [Candidatus Margulisiibacteriota bacterium]
MRTFISVELPDEVKKNIVELINELKNTGAAVKWMEAKNLHITLKFLGWVEDRNLDNLIDLTTRAAAGKGSFKARFEELGTFPEGKSPRVVWVGTAEGGDKLCALAKALEETLSTAGFRKEEREFRPHITIGRIKDKKGVDKLKEKIKSIKDAKFGEVLVDRICIMKSTLTPKGPIYEKVKEVKL